MTTYAAKLASVQDAIETILTSGQEVRIGDKVWKAADIASLRQLEEYYASRAVREEASGVRVRYAVPE